MGHSIKIIGLLYFAIMSAYAGRIIDNNTNHLNYTIVANYGETDLFPKHTVRDRGVRNPLDITNVIGFQIYAIDDGMDIREIRYDANGYSKSFIPNGPQRRLIIRENNYVTFCLRDVSRVTNIVIKGESYGNTKARVRLHALVGDKSCDEQLYTRDVNNARAKLNRLNHHAVKANRIVRELELAMQNSRNYHTDSRTYRDRDDWDYYGRDFDISSRSINVDNLIAQAYEELETYYSNLIKIEEDLNIYRDRFPAPRVGQRGNGPTTRSRRTRDGRDIIVVDRGSTGQRIPRRPNTGSTAGNNRDIFEKILEMQQNYRELKDSVDNIQAIRYFELDLVQLRELRFEKKSLDEEIATTLQSVNVRELQIRNNRYSQGAEELKRQLLYDIDSSITTYQNLILYYNEKVFVDEVLTLRYNRLNARVQQSLNSAINNLKIKQINVRNISIPNASQRARQIREDFLIEENRFFQRISDLRASATQDAKDVFDESKEALINDLSIMKRSYDDAIYNREYQTILETEAAQEAITKLDNLINITNQVIYIDQAPTSDSRELSILKMGASNHEARLQKNKDVLLELAASAATSFEVEKAKLRGRIKKLMNTYTDKRQAYLNNGQLAEAKYSLYFVGILESLYQEVKDIRIQVHQDVINVIFNDTYASDGENFQYELTFTVSSSEDFFSQCIAAHQNIEKIYVDELVYKVNGESAGEPIYNAYSWWETAQDVCEKLNLQIYN